MTTERPTPTRPVDPDVDLHVPAQRRERTWDPAVLSTIAAGGVLGAEARYGLTLALPHQPGQWPWATWLVNISGCLLIGVLMVVIMDVITAHRLVRPFLGIGFLGGYTTFSTAMVDVHQLALAGHGAVALGYMAATVFAAVTATFLGAYATRTCVRWRRSQTRPARTSAGPR